MKKTMIASLLFALAGMANAASYSYSFADVQDGKSGDSVGTSASVASLVVADAVSNLGPYTNAVSFSLTNTFGSSLRDASAAKVKNLSFSSGSFLGGWLVYGDTTGFTFKTNDVGTAFTTSGYSVEFTTSGAKAFGDGEVARWTVYGDSGLNASDFSQFLLHVNATGGYRDATGALKMAGAESIHFAALAPVPEPETYAMLLAGLGLMATIARRRRNKPD